MSVSREIDDPQLVERTLRGDSEAFGALVDRYQGYVYGFIYRKIDNFADEAVLRLDGNAQCLTEAVFRNGRAESTVKLRLGEGLCLVRFSGAPLYIEDAVVREARSTDTGAVRLPLVDPDRACRSLKAICETDRLFDRAFELGLSPETGIDIVLCHVDRMKNTITIQLPGIPDATAVLDFSDFSGSFQYMHDLIEIGSPFYGYRLNDNGNEYRVVFAIDGNRIRSTFTRVVK
jgi:hypothetical protein